MDDLDALIAEYGLEARRDAILHHALPAIHVETTSGEPPVGTSKFGGQPDVPPGFAWPRVPPTPDWPAWGGTPLAFLAQFRLADVAAHDAEGALPHAGMLYFFYEVNEQPWGSHPIERGGSHVFAIEDTADLAPAPFPNDLAAPFSHCAVQFTKTTTLLPWEYDAFTSTFAAMSEADMSQYHQLRITLNDRAGPMHQLLGYPHIIQNDMRAQCQLVANGGQVATAEAFRDADVVALPSGAENWRLLLQLDSDDAPGSTWGDGGQLSFWIERERLARRDFSNVWLVLQSY